MQSKIMSEVNTSEASTAKAQEKDEVLTASSKTMSEVNTSKALTAKAQENVELPASAEEVMVSEGSYSFTLILFVSNSKILLRYLLYLCRRLTIRSPRITLLISLLAIRK
jgi:hypothetical protein